MSVTSSSTTEGASSLDDAPVTSFHRRIMAVAMGGPFCDGYLLGVMGVALGLITPALALDTLWTGLVAASVLIGVFIGGVVFGPITDRVGRHLMYVLNLAAFVVFSALQFFVAEAWQLVVLRLLIGVAIGADYPIASALTTELVPRRLRGPALSEFLQTMYGNEPAQWSDALTGSARLRVIVNALTRLRFCTGEGVMEFESKDGMLPGPEGFLPWFDVPGRKTATATVAFGHWSTLGWLSRPDLLSTDTGCVWGGCLSAVRIGATLDQRELIQVKCEQAQKPGKGA